MKRKYARNLILGLISVLLWRCDSDDPNVKNTATQAMAGEWYVTVTLDGDDFNGGYSKIITSNTAANKATEMLLSDFVEPNAPAGNFWSYKVKIQVDPSAKTFSASEAASSVEIAGEDEPYETSVNVLNGMILAGKGHSKTGVTVDSIYFELQFSDDGPAFGNTYVVSGHKRTGFNADDY